MRATGPLVVALVLCHAGALAGQATARWKPSVYPAEIHLSGNTGPQIGVGFGYSRKADTLSTGLPDASFTASAGYGWRGSWFGSLALRAPGLWPRWRVVLTGLARREARFEFLGLGNESVYVTDSVNDTQPYFYKARRTRYRATLEGTRAISASWSVALAAGVARTRFDSLAGPSLFLATYGSAVVETDRTARLSVVFDGRDSESDARRGVFVEVSATLGSGGGGYTRYASIVRAYVPLGAQTSAAMRVASTRTVGRLPLSARFEVPMWEGPIEVLGAPVSHRGLRSQRFVGRDVEFGTAEVRHRLFRRGRIEFLGAAFVDVGRVFEGEPSALTLKGLKYGPGVGLGVRWKGKSVVHLFAAHGPDGVVFSSRTGWGF
ncbi:MAG TPA: BamA/TamA family outer membrane protein [Gemmatimonadales bacterium]